MTKRPPEPPTAKVRPLMVRLDAESEHRRADLVAYE